MALHDPECKISIEYKPNEPRAYSLLPNLTSTLLAISEIGLKNLGVGVIVISHRMDDIFTVSDRVMALFQGANFAESALKETSRDEVIGWIMGKKI